MITPAQENERTLARILGIAEDEAAQRLNRSIAITHGDGEAAALAAELVPLLERTVRIANPGEAGDVEVVIGTPPNRLAGKQIYVTMTSSGVSVASAPGDHTMKLGPVHGLQRMIAACYVASVALDCAIGLPQLARGMDPFEVRFESLGAAGPLLDRPLLFEDTALLGGGAVGNGFLRALRHLPVSGSLDVVDPKVVGPGNPNRCLYFDESDVGKPKAPTLCEKAKVDFADLQLRPFVGTFDDFLRSKAKGRARRIIVGVDSRPARRTIQKGLPLEAVDASTTGVEEIIVHSHRQPTTGACLSCIYKHVPDELARERDIAAGLGLSVTDVRTGFIDERVAAILAAHYPKLDEKALIGMAFDSLHKQLCGQQLLRSASGEQSLAPFAFVSNLAGALLALEVARLEAGIVGPGVPNYFFTNPWAPPNPRARTYRRREPNCEFCGSDLNLAVMAAVWADVLVSAN